MKWFWCCFALTMTLSTVADVPIPKLPSEGAGQTLELYRDAANHGSPRAMLALAHYNEFGIGMATNRAEALRWYRGVLTSPSGSTKDVVEAAESGIRRLGADVLQVDTNSTNGNYFLEFIAFQANRESAYFASSTLRHKLLGKTLVFTNMVVRYCHRRNDGVVKLDLGIPDGCRCRRNARCYVHDYYPSVCVFFDGADAELARRYDGGDKIARVEAKVVTDWTWQHGGMAVKGISVEPQDRSLHDSLPPFDASTITGDELLDYIKRQRRIRKWQYDEIQSRLVGRRLVFHNLRPFGSSGTTGDASDSAFWLRAIAQMEKSRADGGAVRVDFKLSFSSDSARRLAHRINWICGVDVLDEVTGTFVRTDGLTQGWTFQLEDASIALKGMDLDMPDDGKSPLPGDEIVRKFGRNFTPIAKLGLCSRFAGREICFTSGVVAECRADWASNTVTLLCRMAPKDPENGCSRPLHVSFVIPAERMKTLRRTPIPGDMVCELKGRLADIPTSDAKKASGPIGRLQKSGGFCPAAYTIELEQPEVAMLWMSDVAKTNGLETKAGERIVRRLGLCWKEVRQDQLLRLAQQVNGKHVDFPSGRVRMTTKRGDGSVLVTVALEDPLLGECVELPLIVPPGKLADQSSIMKCGIRVKNIQGVLTVESGKLNNWEPETMCVQLKDATFEIVMPKR